MSSLEIRILRDHVAPSGDVNIVVDVLRAFTAQHFAFLRGASEILLCSTVEGALELRKAYPAYLLMGEVRGVRPRGFDLGNSPSELRNARVSGKGLIHRTGNGTQAALGSLTAPLVLVTGFSNARTTGVFVREVLRRQASFCAEVKRINILASDRTSDDDFACAEFIRSVVLGPPKESIQIRERILLSEAAERLRHTPGVVREDIELSVEEIESDFVMQVVGTNPPRVVRRVMESALLS